MSQRRLSHGFSIPIPSRSQSAAILFVFLWGAVSASTSLHAQEEKAASESNSTRREEKEPLLPADQIQARIKAIEQNKEKLDDAKKKLVEDYSAILEQYKIIADWEAQIAKHTRYIEAAPRLEAEQKAKLAESPVDALASLAEETPLAAVEKLLAETNALLVETQKKAKEREEEPKRRAARHLEAPKLQAAAKKRLDEMKKYLDVKPLGDQAAETSMVRRTLLAAKCRAAELEIEALRQEIAYYDATFTRRRIEQDLLVREIGTLTRQAQKLRLLVDDRRKKEAETQRLTAKRAAAHAHPAVKELAEHNAKLAEKRSGVTAKLADASKQLEAFQKELKRLDEQSAKIKKRVDTGGLTSAIGMLLRKQAMELGDTSEHRRRLGKRQAEVTSVQLDLLDHETDRADLADSDAKVQQAVDALSTTTDADHLEYLRLAVQEQISAQRNYLDALIKDLQDYFEKLIELDAQERRLVEATDQFGDYIAERVLWVRNGGPVARTDLPQAWQSALWLASPANWRSVRETLASDLWHNPFIYSFAALILLAMTVGQPKFRCMLKRIGDQVSAKFTQTFHLTIVAMGLTVLTAVYAPMIIWFIAWRLGSVEDGGVFVRSAAAGLQATAGVALAVELLRQLCRRKGVAEAHFRWKARSLRQYRWSLYWLLIFEGPIVFVVASLNATGDEVRHLALGRLCFISGLTMLALFAYNRLRRGPGVAGESGDMQMGAWFDRLRILWFPLIVGTPILLAIIAGMGFYYTANKLGQRLLLSVLLGWGVVVLNAVLLRWLFVARGKLALEQAKRRRSAEAEAADQPDAQAVPLAVDDGPAMDLSQINLQTRKLLRSFIAFSLIIGTWLIWVDVLPALGILERFELWDNMVKVTETIHDANGTARTETTEKNVPITLADLAAAAAVVLMTSVAAKNVPGLLEISILQRVPLDNGGRYAIATISRYLITLMGVCMSCWAVGIGWANVQWLAAAFTVGLGFGLQEIFANFISGLILLFERPVRVGDTLTVGDTNGVVSRIRIRATTIVDGNRKELIIPNKEFITGKIVNWTLSDRTLKSTIPVCVSQNCNVQQVLSILMRVASNHPLVLKDPGPKAVLDGFSDGQLKFNLSFLVGNLDNMCAVRHELTTGVDQAFRDAHVEVYSPIYEVHLRGDDVAAPSILEHKPERDRRSA